MTSHSPFEIWLALGILLVASEFIVPGLVVVFLGLGALTVAGLLHFNYIESLNAQLLAWFTLSIVYIFSLRFLVMRYYPTDTEKQEINEDVAMIGRIVEVTDKISAERTGRVSFGESTWTALYSGEGEILPGEKVMIIGRDNISWVVKKVSEES
jgi:membrane protein implicated in regulation of membrane protease activity